MSEPKTIDVEVTPATPPPIPPPQTQAVTVRDAVQAVERAAEPKPQVTAAQAKVEAVANLTLKAYERASMLTLTPDEITALQAEFPDEAFKPGAAGKEHLIYIEHAFLRDRLNAVIGIGQWALIPRSRWAEDYSFRNSKGQMVDASRVYVEAMLTVRGAFVAEAVGEMEYYKNNQGQNYADAVEGAKTAALRRCCKEFGIGLQAWKKDWCAGWWARENAKRRAPRQNQQPRPPPAAQQKAPLAPPTTQQATAEQVFPVVTVASIKEIHSDPDAKKQWTAYIVTFDDGYAKLEVGTYSKTIAALANELANTGETARLVTRPGKKQGTFEIAHLERAEQPPEQAPEQDDLPMGDDAPPVKETIP